MNIPTKTPPAIRWQLLSTVSALALLASACAAGEADAAGSDADRPSLWIELGGQMENVSGQGEIFAPAFIAANSTSSVLQNITPLQAQVPPKFSFGEEGKISFQPEGSDWIFSAAARIGRSSNRREVDHQTNKSFYDIYKYGVGWNHNIHFTQNFADTQARHSEDHAILDFSAGKDVGLGMFGKDASSVLSVGVRFAQFTSNSAFDIRARPDLQFKYLDGSAFIPGLSLKLPYFHTYHATGQSSRDFRGVGPSLSWTGSAPLVGDAEDGEVTFDWGANAALLFGRQKARVRHQESAHYVNYRHLLGGVYYTAYQHPPGGHSNVRSVTVPNIGGTAGVSWRVKDFKVSMGYRADVFFGAMDTGIDAVKKSNATFNGPYASISVGLGD